MIWFDLIVFLVILFYIWDGYRHGFVRAFYDLFGIAVAFIVSLKFYNVMGSLFVTWGLAFQFSKPIGFLFCSLGRAKT